jgi:hypothetical protein
VSSVWGGTVSGDRSIREGGGLVHRIDSLDRGRGSAVTAPTRSYGPPIKTIMTRTSDRRSRPALLDPPRTTVQAGTAARALIHQSATLTPASVALTHQSGSGSNIPPDWVSVVVIVRVIVVCGGDSGRAIVFLGVVC